jgi:anti-sigma B factor antagonist
VNPEQLEIHEETDGDVRVVALSGELDVATAPMLSERLDALIGSTPDAHVLVELSALAFMDSMGLQVLLGALRRLGREGRRLALVCPPGPILRLLVVTNLDAAFDVHADRAAAARALTRQTGA